MSFAVLLLVVAGFIWVKAVIPFQPSADRNGPATIAGTASSVLGNFRFGVGFLVASVSTVLPFGVQTNMALTMVVSAVAAMVFFRLYRGVVNTPRRVD